MLIDKDKIAELIYGDAVMVTEIDVEAAAERIEAYLLEGAAPQIGMGIYPDLGGRPARVAVMSLEDAELFASLDRKHRAVVMRRRAAVETAWEVLGDE